MTFLDGCLSTGILTALVLNAWLGWWWTDATAALLVAGFAVNEGIEHWRESAPHPEELDAPNKRTLATASPQTHRPWTSICRSAQDLPLRARPRTAGLADMGAFLRGGAVAVRSSATTRRLHRGTTIDWNRRSSDSAPTVVASGGGSRRPRRGGISGKQAHYLIAVDLEAARVRAEAFLCRRGCRRRTESRTRVDATSAHLFSADSHEAVSDLTRPRLETERTDERQLLWSDDLFGGTDDDHAPAVRADTSYSSISNATVRFNAAAISFSPGAVRNTTSSRAACTRPVTRAAGVCTHRRARLAASARALHTPRGQGRSAHSCSRRDGTRGRPSPDRATSPAFDARKSAHSC